MPKMGEMHMQELRMFRNAFWEQFASGVLIFKVSTTIRQFLTTRWQNVQDVLQVANAYLY